MASSSGTSSAGPGSSLLQNSGSEEDLQVLMDQRKRKRMISNRESAKRSRARKQKHLDDLMGQVAQLSKEKTQIIAGMSVTAQHYAAVEAENSVLRAQYGELSQRLQSLNEIICFLNCADGPNDDGPDDDGPCDGLMMMMNNNYSNSSSSPMMMGYNQYVNYHQPIMASADMLQY